MMFNIFINIVYHLSYCNMPIHALLRWYGIKCKHTFSCLLHSVLQWKFYSLAIPKLGVILFVGKLNADGETLHLQRWGPILFLGFPRGFIPFFGVGESLKLAGFGQ